MTVFSFETSAEELDVEITLLTLLHVLQLDKYREVPQLLDSSLQQIIQPLADKLRECLLLVAQQLSERVADPAVSKTLREVSQMLWTIATVRSAAAR